MLRLVVSLSIAAGSLFAAETGFLNRKIQVAGTTHRYQVYLPDNYTKSQKWPVILFLHGAGERGSDGLKQTDVGLGRAIRFHRDRFPAVVVMPQALLDNWWAGEKMSTVALAALDKSIKEFKGDPDRVYLTGLSMGGYGSWYLAEKYPQRWAAVAPVCGGIRPPAAGRGRLPDPGEEAYARAADATKSLPIWLFHGGADPTVPPDESRKMNELLKARGASVKYTEYPGVGHNSWDRAYGDADFAKWLFEQRRAAPAKKK